jgi:hypothetical protein
VFDAVLDIPMTDLPADLPPVDPLEEAASPELFATLTAIAPDELSDGDLLRYVAAADRLTAFATSLGVRAVAELDRRLAEDWPEDDERARLEWAGLDPVHDSTAAELMALSKVTRQGALHRIYNARALADNMPSVLAAYQRGRMSPAHLRAYTELLRDQPQPVIARVVYRTLWSATRVSVTRLRHLIRRALAEATPAEPEPPQPILDHSLQINRAEGWLSGQFSPDETALIDAALSALAKRTPGDTRNLETRLAEALLDLCSRAMPEAVGGPPTAMGGTRVHIGVLATAETLLGVSEQPGELLGHGPIPAPTVRRLACNGLFTRLLLEPVSGQLLDVGRAHRDPSEALRRHLAARDQHCQFPGCHQPAHRCEPHHCEYWSRGGRTDRRNLVTLCRRHHRAAHEGGWHIDRPDEHTTVWTSPGGTISTTYAPSFPVQPRAG